MISGPNRHIKPKSKTPPRVSTVIRPTPQSILDATIVDSLKSLIALRDNPEYPATVRLRAAQDLLDRALGKAVTRVEADVESTVTQNVSQSTVDRLVSGMSKEDLASLLSDIE